jgi:predicted MPP superfamily phosphohydrolase
MKTKNTLSKSQKALQILWDTWCIVSIVGIWPRFIEYRLLSTTNTQFQIPSLPKELEGLKILQFSDLHLNETIKDSFLEKVIKKTKEISPDIIVFTGDFLSYALLDNPKRLQKFLNSFNAPFGCYAILGNHDYQTYASINKEGDYDISNASQPLSRGLKRLWYTPTISKNVTPRAKATPPKQELIELLKQTPFKLLCNETQLIPIRNSHINISGLGEHMLGHCLPEKAFKNYDPRFPGIILCHNPDGIPNLKDYPGDVILCGHTHGGQINIPGLCKKFMILENPQFKRGLFKIKNKWAYINRGIGSSMQFRWFSIPEISVFTLKSK